MATHSPDLQRDCMSTERLWLTMGNALLDEIVRCAVRSFHLSLQNCKSGRDGCVRLLISVSADEIPVDGVQTRVLMIVRR